MLNIYIWFLAHYFFCNRFHPLIPFYWAFSSTDTNMSLMSIISENFSFCAGSSRGPSPLTMGAQDTLPVAAAFTETVNAYFKGADPSK